MQDPWQIAAWRFELIAPFLDPSLSAAERKHVLLDLCRNPPRRPLSEEDRKRGKEEIARSISRSTVFRWLAAYRRKGIEGLLPCRRKDCRKRGTATGEEWVKHAMHLLFERPDRSLTQLVLYLKVRFAGFSFSRSTLDRRIRAHPAYHAVVRMRSAPKRRRLRTAFEASRPHQLWQLDGKGPFSVKFVKGGWIKVHVLSIMDDHSRMILAATIASAEDIKAAVGVFRRAARLWGLPERIQFDRGSAFESWSFRQGLAQLGAHRNWMRPRNPEANGKIERYHSALGRWFVDELPHQEVIDRVHLEELLQATIEVVYNDHPHRVLKTSPRAALANRVSERRVTDSDLARVFWTEIQAKSHPRTGHVRLPNGIFQVPARYAGLRGTFRYDPGEIRAALVVGDGIEIPIEPVETKHPFDREVELPRHGAGELQKILDRWRGHERPLAPPGFGLPEIFALLSDIVGYDTPRAEDEARQIRQFYEAHGPLAQGEFERALGRTKDALGRGRALKAYLDHLVRQIRAAQNRPRHPNSPEDLGGSIA
jgi:transposase InsO family protein